jgi:hypothetical protein
MEAGPTIWDFTTVADLVTYINPNLGTTDQTNLLLQTLITSTSRWICRFLNRIIPAQAYTEVRNGNGVSAMKTKQWPILSVQSVTWQYFQPLPPAPVYTLTPGLISSDEWFIYLQGFCFPVGYQNVTLGYTAGYLTPGQEALSITVEGAEPLPDDLTLACWQLCALSYKRRTRIGDSSHGEGPERVSYIMDAMDKATRDILMYHKEVAPWG